LQGFCSYPLISTQLASLLFKNPIGVILRLEELTKKLAQLKAPVPRVAELYAKGMSPQTQAAIAELEAEIRRIEGGGPLFPPGC
jgi:hypothetical protein